MIHEDVAKTSGFTLLKLEQKFVDKFNPKSLDIFNSIIFEISNSIIKLNPLDKKDLKESIFFILKFILRELDKKGYKYKDSSLFFYERIINKKVSCKDFAILYFSIFEF